MWSDASRAAAAEARKKGAMGHNAGQGNRKVAKHIKDQHDQHKSVVWGAVKGAAIGAVTPDILGGGIVAGARSGAASARSYNQGIDASKPKGKRSK